MQHFSSIWSRIRSSPLAKDTAWMMMAQGGSVILQAIYFILIARTLGVADYGLFVGTTALSNAFAPFATFGSGELLVQAVARNRDQFRHYWGKAICTTCIFGALFSIVVLGLSTVLLPKSTPVQLVGWVVLSDLFCFRLVTLSWQAYQAVGQMKQAAQLSFTPLMLRVIAVIGFALGSGSTATEWSVCYFIVTLIAAAIGILRVNHDLGLPIWGLFPPKGIKEGLYFAIGISGQTIYNDLDKTMLTRFSTLEAAGFYASAYRIIDVAFVPIRSLLFSTFSRFFQRGKAGIVGSVQVATQVLPIAMLYGLLAAVGLIAIAPIVPYILGDQYAGSVTVLQWLAPLPLLKAMHYFAADTLTGAGFQAARSLIQVGIAVFNVGINLWLIPRYSWQGAIWSSLASDSLLLIALWLCVAGYRHKQLMRMNQND